MRASIRQVAEKAQVGRSTVSRVLRGRKNEVSPETYERVLAVIHELNYVPVQSAVQTRQVETKCIGLVPQHRDAFANPFDAMTFNGLCRAASRHDYDVFVMLRGEAEWMANREELRFLDRRSDGFIFVSPGCGEWQVALETLVEHEIPVVVCYRRDVPEGVAWVDPDNEAIIESAVECLTRHGHRRLAYFGGPKPDASACNLLADLSGTQTVFDDDARAQAFVRILEQQGHPEPEIFHVEDATWNLQPWEVQALLQTGATGVLCVNDLLAIRLWNYVESQGFKVPQDLSIISIGDDPQAAHRGLTSVVFRYDDVGVLAMEAWNSLKSGAEPNMCCKIVPGHLVERSSVSEPRKAARLA